MSRFIRAVIAALILITTTASRAEVPLLRDNYYEVGAVYSLGGYPMQGTEVGLTGLRFYERNGFFGKALWTIFISAAMALGQSDSVYLGSEYGPGYRVDYSRSKTADELAEDARARDEAVDAAAMNEYETDIQIFWPKDGLGQGKGYNLASYPFSFNLGPSTIDIGFHAARIASSCKDPGGASAHCRYIAFGMPVRISFDLWSRATLDLQADVNFLALAEDEPHVSHAHPVTARLSLHPFERVFVRGGVTLPDLSTDDLGLSLEAGVRF